MFQLQRLRIQRIFWAILLMGFFLSTTIPAQSRVHSYIDENGRRIITNIPFDHAPIDTPEPAPAESIEKAKEAKKGGKAASAGKDKAELAIQRAEEKAKLSDKTASNADRLAAQTDRTADQVVSTVNVPPVPTTENSKLPSATRAVMNTLPVFPFTADPEYVDSLINKYADHHGLEPDLIRAVIKTESNFNPMAVSPKGARGLMQLMPDTARRYGVRRIYDPEENIAGGVRYLKDLLEMFDGNIPLALSGYNAGENRVLRSGGIPNIPETRNYVTRISRMFNFDRSPFLSEPEFTYPQTPPIRRFVNSQGMIEITNVGYGQ